MYQPAQQMKMMVMNSKTLTHWEYHPPWFSGTCRCTSSWHPAILMTIRLSIKVRLPHHRGTTRLWYRLFLYIKLDPNHWLGSGILTEVEDWHKPSDNCWLACASDKLMWPYRQGSLGGTESFILWTKGNWEVQTSQCCLGAELKRC